MKSIIIAITTDRPAAFKKSLEHNFPRVGCPTDLLIIDNGSVDEETKIILERFAELFQAKIIALPFHTGLGNAMNIGLKFAFDGGYEYIQFCGNNILESDHWLLDKILCAASTPGAGMIAAKFGDHQESISGDLSATPGTISSGQPLITRKLAGTIGYFNPFGGLNGPVLEDYSLRAAASGLNSLLLRQRFFSYLPPMDPVTPAELDHAHHRLVTMGEHRENIRHYKNARNLYRPFQIDDRRLNPGNPYRSSAPVFHK
jgi:glycosyltransferase involved in cell wall biosynthesis